MSGTCQASDTAESLFAVLQASQKMTNSLMLATCMMNIGTLFSVSAMASAATASFVGASAFGLISLINFAKVKKRPRLPRTFLSFMHEPCRSAPYVQFCPYD